MAGCDAQPVLEPTRHDLDAVEAFAPAFVVSHSFGPGLSAGDALSYALVLKGFSEPIGVIATIPKQPFDVWQAAQ